VKKAGAMDSGLKGSLGAPYLASNMLQVLQRAGDGALLLRGEMGVSARQDFAGVGHEMAHHFRGGEGDLLRRCVCVVARWCSMA